MSRSCSPFCDKVSLATIEMRQDDAVGTKASGMYVRVYAATICSFTAHVCSDSLRAPTDDRCEICLEIYNMSRLTFSFLIPRPEHKQAEKSRRVVYSPQEEGGVDKQASQCITRIAMHACFSLRAHTSLTHTELMHISYVIYKIYPFTTHARLLGLVTDGLV